MNKQKQNQKLTQKLSLYASASHKSTSTQRHSKEKKNMYILSQQPVFATEAFPQRVVLGQVIQSAAHEATTVKTPADFKTPLLL